MLYTVEVLYKKHPRGNINSGVCLQVKLDFHTFIEKIHDGL